MGTEVCVKRQITPERLIFKQEVKKIIAIHHKFIVNEYKIQFTDDRKITRVFLDTFHPNCDPRTKEFCLPVELKGEKFDRAIIPFVENLIRTFNLDNCFYQPWSEFEYE